jgi:pilus assembly protein CpaC
MSIRIILRSAHRVLVGLACLALAPAPAFAEESTQTLRVGASANLSVPIYKSRTVALTAPAKRVSVGNPDIADVLILRSDELYVLGKDLGATNVMLWDRNDNLISAIAVVVTHDLDGLKRQLATVLPGEAIQVHSVQRNLVLAGQVSSPVKMDAAIQLASSYLEQAATAKDKIFFEEKGGGGGGGGGGERKAGQVINLMSVGGAQQVMLQVKVAEVRRDLGRKLQSQLSTLSNSGNWVFGGVSGGATFPDAVGADGLRVPIFTDGNPLGPVFDEFLPNPASIGNTGIFASYLGSEFVANLVLDIAKQNGLAKILAEPTLTALTGQEAQFLSGGSFPIPVGDNDGISVEFKDFGVKLLFVPVILDNGRINLKLNVSVSELLPTNTLIVSPNTTSGQANSLFAIPALSERRALTTVELSDGQTIGIAGLINETMRESIEKLPWLGDIPILGQLFRSQAFQKGETELVILVTPKLAKALKPSEIRLPTDNVIEPSDAEFYILGKMQGRGSTTSASSGATSGSPENDGESRLAGSASGDATSAGTPVARDDATVGGPGGAFGHALNSKSIPGGSK